MTQLSLKKKDSMKKGSQKLVKINYLLQNSAGGNRVNKTVNKSMDFLADLSKDFSLYLSILEKPINLLFSIDQFLFELSKKTYQQKKNGEFFQQLKERKKLSLFYGHLTRKHLVHLMNMVKDYEGYFSKNFFSLLEQRLDVVLFRSGITRTVAEARQLIKHKKILVNQTFMNVPSVRLDPGDILSMVPETATVSASNLLKSVRPQLSVKYPKIFGDFYSKFRKTVEKPLNAPNVQGFQSLAFCNVLLESLCTEMKVRCFWTLKKNANEICTLFKWKSFSRGSPDFTKIRTSLQKNFSEKKPCFSKIKPGLVYASAGSLQKKPLLWGRHFMNFKQNQNVQVKNQKTSHSLKNSHKSHQTTHKNMKSLTLHSFSMRKSTNLAFHRTSFLLFLKRLETHKKFTSLVALNLKKHLFKTSFLRHKSVFSRTLTFRVTKPLHLEVSYNLLNLIYLYSPQRVNFPFYINLDMIFRSLR